MQQMAYSGYQAPQQTAVAPMLFANSVLPMVAGSPYNHWHVVREDFQKITADKADADFLRDIENQTNFLIKRLCQEGLVPEKCLPDPDDLWVVSSGRKATERTLHAWGHAKYSESVLRLLDEGKGFLKRRFAAPLLSLTFEEGPMTTIFLGPFDRQPYIVIDDEKGNYQGIDGEIHNAFKEGHALASMIRWEYQLCVEKIQAAQYALAFLDPPKPAKRWPPIVKRRDPVPQKGNGDAAPTDCDPNSARAAPNDQPNPSQTLPQGGTSKAEVCEEGSGHSYHTVDTKDMSTIRQEKLTNIPISSAIPLETEQFLSAPWGTETLIGLAQSRHTPGLFECVGDDGDEEAAQWLIEETRDHLGDGAKQAWERIERHIAWMIEDSAPSWWVRDRGQRSAVTLRHVVGFDKKTELLNGFNWRDAEHKMRDAAWYPSRTTPYDPDPKVFFEEEQNEPRDHTWIFGGNVEPAHQDSEEQPGIVEGSLDIPEPAPVRVAGMVPSYAANLITKIYEEYPSLSAHIETIAPYKQVIRIEYAPGAWFTIERLSDWNRPSEETKRLIEMAVAASQPAKEEERSDACIASASDQLADGPQRDDHRGTRGPDHRNGPPVPKDHLRV